MLNSSNILAVILCTLLVLACTALLPFTATLTTGHFAHLRPPESFNRRVYLAIVIQWLLSSVGLLIIYFWSQEISATLWLFLEIVILVFFLCFALYLTRRRCPFCKRLLASEPSARGEGKQVCTSCGKSW